MSEEKTYTDTEIAEMREKGKELGIQNYHNMKPENLAEKIKEAEGAGGDDVAGALAAMKSRLDSLESENAELKEKVEFAEMEKDDGNPNVMLYHKELAPRGKVFTPPQVKKARKDGWVDTPEEWRDELDDVFGSVEPKKIPGGMYLGKKIPAPKTFAAGGASNDRPL